MDVKLEAEEKIRLPKSALAREELRPDAEPAGPMGVTAPPRGFEFSPLNARRWRNFKANRRGYYSLWLFLVLFIISLFAEFIANDRPLYIHVDGYSQCDALEMNWLGTDDQGRDVLARLIYGFRISVLFGLILTIVSSIIGIAAGAVQGYFGGWTDLLFQRFIEIWTSVPELYLLLIISSVLVPGFFVLLGIQLLFSWVRLVGLVRAEFLRGRNFEYIQAARALGVSNRTIMFRHLLPNAMVATMTFLPFIMSSSVMTLTALDFLGFGLPPGSPSLGELLSQGKANVQAPWLGLTGFFTVALMLSLLIFIGEAVRDAFDPRKTFA